MIKRDSRFIVTMLLIFLVLNGLLLFLGNVQARDIHDSREYWHSWGVDPQHAFNIQLPDASATAAPKKSVVVAVIDTGIDPRQPHLKENLVHIKGKASEKQYGKDFSFGSTSVNQPFDQHGHGTHIAGIIKSVFPQVKLLTLKYYNPNASGRENLKSTLKALKFAIDSNVDIINYSGGGPESSVEELTILKQAEAKGILIVAASGNEGQALDHGGQQYFPASYKLSNIITVTTIDEKGQMHPTSNWGTATVDIAAPGDRIKSTLPFGRAGFLTGTSQSTAFVSGVAAMLKATTPKLKAADLKKIILASAAPVAALKDKCRSGGILSAQTGLALAANQYGAESASERKVASNSKIIYRLKSSAKAAQATP